MKKKDEIKVCLVGSSGGHLTHLYMLKPFWKDKNRFWVTFDKEDAAEKKYERKMNPMVDLANYFACVQPSYSFDAINSSFLSNRLDTKDYCFYIDENSIFAENRQLPHKDAGIFDDFYMIPVKKGDAKIKIYKSYSLFERHISTAKN